MQLRVGYELIYDCPQPTPMILTLHIHFTRISDVIVPDHLITNPSVPITAYRDTFGNWCSRIVAPKGQLQLTTDAVVNDSGAPDLVAVSAQHYPVQDLPGETLVFLQGSRYCDTDLLSEEAWDLFEITHRMVTRPGDLRFRARTCPLRLHAGESDAHRIADNVPSDRASAATLPISPSPCVAA